MLLRKATAAAKLGTTEDAVKFGDIVLLAIPWIKRNELPNARLFEDKVTIDATNPFSPQRDIIDLGDSTSSEEVLKVIPGSRLVKAFNSLNYELLRNNARPSASLSERAVLFVAGDDSEAKEVVAKLIEDIGFAAGVEKDKEAVRAGLTWWINNGMVEGHVTKLKLIKRQGYGQAGFPLLRKRVLHAI
jgi:predicted dinucleotide-binding enzyme